MKLYDGGVFLINGTDVIPEGDAAQAQRHCGLELNREKG